MIELTYINGTVDLFEIYEESNNHITWKDYACNYVRINKHNNKIKILHDNDWIECNLNVLSYRKI